MDETNNAQPETYPLDDAAIELIAQIDEQEKALNISRTAILNYFARQHNLPGNWVLARNRRELTKRG